MMKACFYFVLSLLLITHSSLPAFRKDCPAPPGCCYPYRVTPECNPHAPPAEECCCPPAPIDGVNYGLTVITIAIPVILIVGLAALILSQSENGH